MINREKVIKRLEECLSASCRGFRTCPYSDNEWDAVETALVLLKEQEPVEPRSILNCIWPYSCGECKKPLYAHDFAYCPWCGRRIKWQD